MSESLHDLAIEVCDRFGVPHSRVFSGARPLKVAKVRFAVWAIGRSRGETLAELAALFGHACHGTVSHGLERAEALMASDPDFARIVRSYAPSPIRPKIMTLQKLLQLTAGMPAHTEIRIMDMFGNIGPAAIITPADLAPEDPALESWPHDCLVIGEDADLAGRDSL